MNVLCLAFVLVVLCAAAGGLPGIDRAARGGDGAVAVVLATARPAGQPPGPVAHAQPGIAAWRDAVRAAPRTRSVARRGLPPARAPTA